MHWHKADINFDLQKFDLAVGAISVTEDRIEAVDFTNPFLEDTSSILSNKPQQRSRILIFIKVFPWQVIPET